MKGVVGFHGSSDDRRSDAGARPARSPRRLEATDRREAVRGGAAGTPSNEAQLPHLRATDHQPSRLGPPDKPPPSCDRRPSRRPTERLTLRLTGSALAVVLTATACSAGQARPLSSGHTSSTASTASTSAATTITTLAQVQAVIISQWVAAERNYVAVSKDPAGPDQAKLVDYFIDPELSFLRTQFAARARDGLVDVGDLDLGQPRVVSMTASQAVVTSCETNRLQLIQKATGKPFPGKAGDPTPTPNGIRATMILEPSGVWKLSTVDLQDGSCAAV